MNDASWQSLAGREPFLVESVQANLSVTARIVENFAREQPFLQESVRR
jgi:hypothetical protein